MTYPNGGKFILIYMSISQNKGMLSHDESRKIVSRITKKLQKQSFFYSHILRCLPLQIVHVHLSPYLFFYLLFFAGCFFITCLLRLEDMLHMYLQCSQAKGFSPVCVRKCRFKAISRVQEKSHWSHLKGFSPE